MSFSDIIGHEEQIAYLENSVRKDMIAHSYLYLGPEAVGKKMVAINFAKSLECRFPDLRVIEPSGKGNAITIEDIRELKRMAFLKPYQSLYKVFVIDKAEHMRQESQNAILKILEEAPAKTIFILIASTSSALVPTILSRCHIIRFKAISVFEISTFLRKFHGLEEEKALFLAKISGGRIGQALKMKEEGAIERRNLALERLSNLDKAWEYSDRKNLKDDFIIFISYFRDAFISKVNSDEKYFFNIDKINEIKKEARRFSFDELGALINKLVMLDSYIDANVNYKLIIDSLLGELDTLKNEKRKTKNENRPSTWFGFAHHRSLGTGKPITET